MSSKKDADKFLKMILECFIEKPLVTKLPKSWEGANEKLLHLCSSTTLKNENISFLEDGTLKNQMKILRKDVEYESTSSKNLLNCTLINRTNYELNNTLSNSLNNFSNGILKKILIYPIKSCAPFTIKYSWEIIPTGLKYDRQWMIVNSAGICMTQKRSSYLCLIKPFVHLETNLLEITCEGMPSIFIPLNENNDNSEYFLCKSKVCGDQIQGFDCGQDVSIWLSEALNIPGLRLIKQCEDKEHLFGRTSKMGNFYFSFKFL